MPTILFVHGTGVREPSFSRTFRVVRDKLTALHADWKVERCYWGETTGVQLQQVTTVPPGRTEGDGTVRAISKTASDADLEITVWQLLYTDPLFELRWMANAESPDGDELLAPGQASVGVALRKKLSSFQPSAELALRLDALSLRSAWDQSTDLVVESDELADALRTNNAELNSAVARALVASAISTAGEAGEPAPSATARDALVDLVVQQLGGGARGVKQWLLAPLAGFAGRRVTAYVMDHRSGVSGEAAPAAGDVILYQTRGEKIRAFIADAIARISGPVYVIAHSLGGIASVDLMVMARPANVRGLITVASQAPLLFEFDALTSLRNPGTLPDTFPQWLNIYDPRDFLSYMAEPVFDKHIVKDVEVRSGQPFPQSHSAYWTQDAVWKNIDDFIQRVEAEHKQPGT